MRVEEAIKTIKSNYPPENYTMLRETLDMAIEALEKQIPKSVINRKVWEHVAKTFDTCPNCKEIVGDSERYCHWCGQAVKWN